MNLLRPVFVASQPKAGTYLCANVLLELGYTGGPDGIMHISTGKYELYPYPGQPMFAEARANPRLVRHEVRYRKALTLVKKPNHFAVGHIGYQVNHRRFNDFKVILLTRPMQKIQQSLERWDQQSGRGPSNHKAVLRLAEDVANWKSKEHLMPDNLFKLTFDDMKSFNIERIDELQKWLGVDPIKDSKTVLENAMAKDSVTKVT